MRFRYHTVDVFTDTRFGGNPLAVLPQAEGLDGARMQRIAREFNYSETTFVLPPEDPSHTRRVRIFTPAREMPFAGHPNVGTAFVLASIGALEPEGEEARVVFEEVAGPVPVTIRLEAGRPVACELTAPQPLVLGETHQPDAVAATLSLPAEAIATETHPPIVGTVGVGFVMVEVRDRDALARAAPVLDRLAALGPSERHPGVHLYTRDAADENDDVQCRMFAPLGGVHEDPATGSANCVLAGLLATHDPRTDGELRYRIAQGVEMGRPSRLLATVDKHGGRIGAIRIGGACVRVADGEIEVD